MVNRFKMLRSQPLLITVESTEMLCFKEITKMLDNHIYSTNSQTVFFILPKQHNSFVHPGAVQRNSDLYFSQAA